jgi:tRNA pseudouridine55 synthase
MKKILVIDKKEGETPLEALGVFRKKHKEYKDIKMTYAGRLDPMASGLLLILAGEETKNKEKYLALDKEYEFEILFGFATDTYDILGKVISDKKPARNAFSIADAGGALEKEIKQNLKFFTGKFIQKYPLYSSKTVGGRQLFEYGRSGMEVELPKREVQVKTLRFIKMRAISGSRLMADIEKRIKKVNGDFRQKEIITIWHKHLRTSTLKYNVASLKIKCGSGTYVRGIADSVGAKMAVPALALSIKRTKVGKWSKISKWQPRLKKNTKSSIMPKRKR